MESIRNGGKQSPSRRGIETRTRDACATQMGIFRLAAETDRLAACAPQSFHSGEGAADPFDSSGQAPRPLQR